MNHRLHLSPISHGSTYQSTAQFNFNPAQKRRAFLEEVRFFRSWLIYDSDLEASRSHGQVNWNVLLGLFVAASVSAGGWYGVDVLIRHFVR